MIALILIYKEMYSVQSNSSKEKGTQQCKKSCIFMACMPTSAYVQYDALGHSPMAVYSFVGKFAIQYPLKCSDLRYVLFKCLLD